MTNEILFYTQMASILAYIFTLFGLYRVIVSQKDATIETLKEKISFLLVKLDEALSQSPDVLAKNLGKRVDLLKAEIEHLNEDRQENAQEIAEKVAALEQTQTTIEELQERVDKAKELFEEYTCPHCGSFISERHYYPIHGFVGGRDVEAEGEYLAFECGFATNNGTVAAPCPQT